MTQVSDVLIDTLAGMRDGVPMGGTGNRFRLSERRCPECGFRMASDGISRFVCNRCGHGETKDMRKYKELGKNERIHTKRFLFGGSH